MLIEIEDVIANALIEVKTRNNINCISIIDAEHYGDNVIEKLKSQGINARFYTDRYRFADFKRNYFKYFSVMETGQAVMCYINEGITIEDLEQKFRGYLSVDALLAFIDDEVVSKSFPIPNDGENILTINRQLKKVK